MSHTAWLWVCVLLIAARVEAVYTTVQSKYNKSNGIRIKEHADGDICNGGGKHLTGWADIGARHLFYWYHPVRQGNEEDAPLLVWLQGGPGASSMLGMLMLHGPCLIGEGGNSTLLNPYSWNEEFNVLYLDQPAGVGFSYVDDFKNDDAYPRRTEESAHELLTAITLVYEAFPHLKNTSLFLAGESYGGRYAPVYGSSILEWNANAEEERKIPLASIMIGDGWTSPRDQYPTFYDVGCFEVDGIPAIFNTSVCASLPPIVERCETLLDACVAVPDEIICKAASDYCFDRLLMRIEDDPTNVYDRTVVCPDAEPCYPENAYIETFLNQKHVQEVLEIDKQTSGRIVTFNLSSDLIQNKYTSSGDFGTSSTLQLENIINDASVGVMIYVGRNDWIVTALGTGRMLERMRFQNYARFRGQTKVDLPWKAKEGGVAGTVKKIDGLWFVELNGAGHLVPHDQPHSSLKMVQAWKAEVGSQGSSVRTPENENFVKDGTIIVDGGRKSAQHRLGGYHGSKQGL